MTTEYAQAVHAQARQDIENKGVISTRTTWALEGMGYTLADIAKLENDIKDRIYR